MSVESGKLAVPPAPAGMCEEVAKARAFAIERHGDQRYGDQHYVVHLDDVYLNAVRFGLEVPDQVLAYTHDLREDTNTEHAELVSMFGEVVANRTSDLTGVGKTRQEKTLHTVEALRRRPESAPGKLMDRLANGRRSVEAGNARLIAMYRSEMPLYEQLFRDACPPAFEELCALLEYTPAPAAGVRP